jgi:ABC-2 type transport system permease protein
MRPFIVLFRNHVFGLRTALSEIKEQPMLKVIFITGFSVCWLLGLSWIFYEGFDFLYMRGGVAFYLVPRLFTLFFLGLGFMLILSGAITGYSNLFQTPEVNRLLTWPIPTKDLFYYALMKSTLMSSWAFFFIIVPMITSFGLYRGWGWMMLGWSIVYSVPYVMLFSSIGVFLMLLMVRFFPRGRTLALFGFLGLVAFGYWAIGYVNEVKSNQSDDLMVLVNFIPGLGLASLPILPNSWMANGILAFAKEDIFKGAMYLTLLFSSVGVMFLFLAQLGCWIYPTALQRQFSGLRHQAVRASGMSRLLQHGYPGSGAFRAYGIKDALIFVRDPSQWTQFLIFFGLLALYFINLGSLGYGDLSPVWSNLIAFLNMFSLSAVMSSLSARFVFPQLSMETRTLWMVGLAPQSMSRLMVIKFFSAVFVLGVVGISLSTLSNSMLNLSGPSLTLSRILMPCMAVALAGLSTGLGAIFMEIRPKTPAQILSGYGGTLNLILSLLVVIVMVMVPGVISHLLNEGWVPEVWVNKVFPLTVLYMILISGLAAGLPLWIGHKTLTTRDF